MVKERKKEKKDPLGMGLAAILKSTVYDDVKECKVQKEITLGSVIIKQLDDCWEIVLPKKEGELPLLSAIFHLGENVKNGMLDTFLDKEDCKREALSCNKRGLNFFKKSQYQPALKELKRGIMFDGELPKLYYHLGLVYDEIEEYHTAVDSYKKAVKLKPDDVDFKNNLATAFFNDGQIKEAKELFYSILKVDPQNVLAQENLSIIEG